MLGSDKNLLFVRVGGLVSPRSQPSAGLLSGATSRIGQQRRARVSGRESTVLARAPGRPNPAKSVGKWWWPCVWAEDFR